MAIHMKLSQIPSGGDRGSIAILELAVHGSVISNFWQTTNW